MVKKWFIFLLLAALSSGAQAIETPIAAHSPKTTARPIWTVLRGHVLAISPEAHTLQIADAQGHMTQVNVDKDVQILRYYRVVDFGELKLRERVELRYIGAQTIPVETLATVLF